jgi:methyl-accepting chemotaxis protein
VPPWLPEYLPETIKVIVESLPKADAPERWPIWLSAGATLFGSFGGALLGGIVAYYSTKRVYLDSERKGRHEKIYLEVLSVRLKYIEIFNELKYLTEHASEKPSHSQHMEELGFEANFKMHDLIGLIHISSDQFDEKLEELIDTAADFQSKYNAFLIELVAESDQVSSIASEAAAHLKKMMDILSLLLIGLSDGLRKKPSIID